MKAPRGASGLADRFCYWLEDVYKIAWVHYALAPVLVAVPPWLVAKWLDDPKWNAWLSTTFPRVAEVLVRYDVLFLALASFYSWAVLSFARYVAKRVESRSLDIETLLGLIAAIDQVVGCKLKRFSEHLKHAPRRITAANAFENITQPDLQIAELVRGIADFFNAGRPGKRKQLIRVVLAEIENRRVKRCPVYYPMDEPIKSSVTELSRPNSAIMTAARTRRTLVIENIPKEIKKGKRAGYVDTGVPEDTNGSLFAFLYA